MRREGTEDLFKETTDLSEKFSPLTVSVKERSPSVAIADAQIEFNAALADLELSMASMIHP
jgi:hypothetical protein